MLSLILCHEFMMKIPLDWGNRELKGNISSLLKYTSSLESIVQLSVGRVGE
jgi:hypothetical protein